MKLFGNRAKKIAYPLILTLAFSTIFMGCAGNSEKETKKKVNDNKGNKEVTTGTIVEEENGLEIYDNLFDLSNTISIQIEISEEELDKLQQDYIDYDGINSKSPIYRMCDKVIISVGDEVYELEEVGIRLKGNTSLEPFYDEVTGTKNISHYKLSFNETFDDEEYYGEDAKVWEDDEAREARKNRTFATLEKLEIKWNKNYDDSHIREIVANSLYKEAGVLAQNINLCSLGINGENYGVVNIYEPVDKIFIKRNLPEEDWDGELYKCGWTFKPCNYLKSTVTYGVQDKDEGLKYNFNLKTNKKDPSYDNLENLLTVIGNVKVTKEDFESVVDKDNLINYLAVSYFVGNPDDMRNNYNNHYIYFCKSTGKAIIIPYDTDRCLGLTFHWNPEQTGMTENDPFSEYAEASGKKQTNPLITKSILTNGFFVDEYKAALEKVSQSDYFNMDTFNEMYEIAKENYESVVVPTMTFGNMDLQFKFGLEDELNYSDQNNMSYKDYVELKMDTYKKSVQ